METGAKLIKLPVKADDRGNLSFIEQWRHVPFGIARAYWVYDVPGGESRSGHAYRRGQEFIVALSGCFDVNVDDGCHRRTFRLNRSYTGLYVPAGHWRELVDFSTNSVAMILSSTEYDESDYIRDYQQFIDFCHERKHGE